MMYSFRVSLCVWFCVCVSVRVCVCLCVCFHGRWYWAMTNNHVHSTFSRKWDSNILSYILHSSLFLPVFAIYFTGINSWGIGFTNFAASIIFADIMIAELFCKKYYELIFWLFLMISSFKIIWREIKSSEMYKSMGLFLSILWFLFYKNLT